nr:DivIVA domain-containing protein [Planomonospora venezuelensis]
MGRGTPAGEPITADEIRDARFRTKLGGYNETAVDFALEAFIVAVEARAAQQSHAPDPRAADPWSADRVAEPRAGGPWTGEIRAGEVVADPESAAARPGNGEDPVTGPRTGQVLAGDAGIPRAPAGGPAAAAGRPGGPAAAEEAGTDEIWVAGAQEGESSGVRTGGAEPEAGAAEVREPRSDAPGAGEPGAAIPGAREAGTGSTALRAQEDRPAGSRESGAWTGAAPAAGPGRPRDLWPKPPLPESLAVAGREEQAVRVERVAFRPGRLGMGYDEGEVDVFLDRLVATFRGTAERPLTPQDVREARFTTVMFRAGYSVTQVDGFLAEMAEVLERYPIG